MAKTVKVRAYKKLGPTGKVENVDAHIRRLEKKVKTMSNITLNLKRLNMETEIMEGKKGLQKQFAIINKEVDNRQMLAKQKPYTDTHWEKKDVLKRTY